MTHTLLLADDSPTVQRVIELMFANYDVRVVPVRDGQQAIARMAEMRPDIVLADTAMSAFDGYQVASHVRNDPALAGVPVLLLAGAFELVDDARVRASGAAGVLVKPCEPNIVIDRVKGLLGLAAREPQPPGGRLVTAQGPARTAATPVAAAPAVPRAEPGSPANPAEGSTEWETLGVASGPGPDAVQGQVAATDDDLDLDAALGTLDARLAERSGPRGHAGQASLSPPPAAGRASQAAGRAGAEAQPPVFEVDTEWFDASPSDSDLRPSSPASHEPEKATAPVASASAPADPPPSPAPAATYAGIPPTAADAFAFLLAAEQGEAALPSAPAAPAMSNGLVEVLAARVAERLDDDAVRKAIRAAVGDMVERVVREEADDMIRQVVRDQVEQVAERLVRQEIARIRDEAAKT